MKFGDIWLRTKNGEKINLRDLKEIKKSDLEGNSALISIFNSFDTQKADGTPGSDGILDKNEIVSIFMSICKAAKTTNNTEVFDKREAEAYINNKKIPDGKTLKELGVTASDLFDFIIKLTKNNEQTESENVLTDKHKTLLELIEQSEKFDDNIQIPSWFLNNVNELSEEIYNNLVKVLNDKAIDKIKFLLVLLDLAHLDDKQYELAKEIYNTQERDEPLDIGNIADLILQTEDKNIEFLKSLISMKFGSEEQNLDSYSIVSIANLDEAQREKFFSVIEDKTLPLKRYSTAAILMPIWDSLPKDFLQKYPDFVISRAIDGGLGFSSNIDRNDAYLYDENGNLYEIQIPDAATNTKTVINKKTNTVAVIKYKDIPGYDEPIVESEIIMKYDSITIDDVNQWNIGNLVKATTRTLGNVEGVYIITETDANGKITTPQYESVDEIGNIYVQKDFVSPAGVETHFTYEETVDGMIILDYVISRQNEDNGETEFLLNKHQTIQQMADGRIITSVNNNVYEANFDINKLIITDKTKNVTKTFELDEEFLINGQEIVLNILKKVPANLLMAMDKIPISAIIYGKGETDSGFQNNARWSQQERFIQLGTQDRLQAAVEQKDYQTILNDLLPTFLHEFGHYLDSDLLTGDCNVISLNKELNDVFAKELEKFLEATNSTQQEYISYFIDMSPERSAQERVAESNMILNGLPNEPFANRATYLQQYFPETIAMIAKLIDERLGY